MMKIEHLNENSASAALAELLRNSSIAMHCFLELCEATETPTGSVIEVSHRHKTDQGREIDLLLHCGGFGIIVECKVQDRQKPYQLEPYLEYWRRSRNTEPRLVWLLKYWQNILGNNRLPVTTILWNDVYGKFRSAASTASPEEKRLIEEFCEQLKMADICVAPDKTTTRSKKCKGYNQAHADYILTSIRDAVSDLDGQPKELNELPPMLQVGRKSWRARFPDQWTERIWFFMEPVDRSLVNAASPFQFTGVIRLADSGSGGGKITPELLACVPQWARLLTKHDFSLTRSKPGSWRHSEPLKSPYRIASPVGLKYIHAKESTGSEFRQPIFEPGRESEAIQHGAMHLRWLIAIVESMLGSPS